jgi:cell division protein FtsI (penicillin-binding protein 3)
VRPDRARFIFWSFALFAIALIGRAGYVQVWQRDRWQGAADSLHVASRQLPAPRGTIRDANGLVLAESRERVRISVAPKELRDARATAGALRRVGVDAAVTSKIAPGTAAWVIVPGTYPAADVASIRAMRGVYTTPIAERAYKSSESLRRLVGRATPEGGGQDGLELTLDSLLRGTKGTSALVRDAKGRTLETPSARGEAARAGHSVTLTIEDDLQDLAERALAEAQAKAGARGGDIVVLDPRDGTILALVSRRSDPASTSAGTLTDTYEPGSTLKPFVAGRLLELKRARVDEVIATYNGKYSAFGRKINDLHKAPALSLADVLRWSSNVGIVRFAERLSKREEYELLRDAGFGTPTGLPYPNEASGRLEEPRGWSLQSPASLAMGYEISVSPIQLASAYAAIANGGELLQPSVIKEIRDADGRVVWSHQRRVVRRLFPTDIAKAVRKMLVGVVEGGTATDADLATFAVAGKSGTARIVKHGRYEPGAYSATFVGLFPADDPQLVILAKLIEPAGAVYYGGKVAAPIFKTVSQGVLASSSSQLDRGRLADVQKPTNTGRPAVEATVAPGTPPSTGDVAFVYEFEHPPASSGAAPPRAVPDVHGLTLRRAVFALHEAGFKVELGDVGDGTVPSAGTMLRPGSTVRLAPGSR